MLKVKSFLTSVVNDLEYEFVCSPNSPLDDAIQASRDHLAFLLGRKQQATEAAQTAQPVAVPEQSTTPEVPSGQ